MSPVQMSPAGDPKLFLRPLKEVRRRFDDVHLSGVSGRLIYGPNAVLVWVDP